jgi:hypothetical protein
MSRYNRWHGIRKEASTHIETDILISQLAGSEKEVHRLACVKLA